MTLKYRYIGKGTTDSNGIAHMTEDADGQSCNGYTGTGKGLTDIIASTDDSTHISDSSILSGTYEVLDNLWYDNNTYTTMPTLNKQIGSNGFCLEFDVLLTANNSQCWFRIGTDNNNTIYVGAIYSNQQGIRVNKNGSTIAYVYANSRIVLNELTHIKFTYKDGAMTYTDGDETVTLTNSEITPQTILNGAVISGEVSNIKLYPI